MSTSPLPHAPLGADASFHFGPPGAPAGFAVPAAAPATSAVFVGCRHAPGEAWNLLPFVPETNGGPAALPKGRFGRFLSLAGDKWMIGPLVFKLCTPPPFEDSAADERFRYAPVVCGYLEYDNTHNGDPAELIFGLAGKARELNGPDLMGFAAENSGFATPRSPDARTCRDRDMLDVDVGAVHGLRFHVPPQCKRLFPLALGFYRPGFYHTKLFADLSAVLAHGLQAHARYLAASDAADARFMRSALGFERKNELAVAAREWLARSQRLANDPPIDPASWVALVGELSA